MRKRRASFWMLLFFVNAPVFLGAEVTSGLALFCVTVFFAVSGFKLPRRWAFLCLPMMIIIFVGILGSLGSTSYNAVKDIWYFGKVVLMLVLGYVLMMQIRDLRSLFRIFVASAAVVSLLHVSEFIFRFQLVQQPTVYVLQLVKGRNYINVLAVAIIVGCQRRHLALYPKVKWFAISLLCICSLSLALSFSRSLYISCLMMLFTVSGYLNFVKARRILSWSIKMTVVIIVLAAIWFTIPKSNWTEPRARFLSKIASTLQEIRLSDYDSRKDIITHWRGYETFRALRAYLDGTVTQYIIGKGFGTLVDLGLYRAYNGGVKLRLVPVVHNGYVYILLKTGLVGLLLYLFYLFRFFQYGLRCVCADLQGGDLCFVGELIAGVSLVFLVTTVGTLGIFGKNMFQLIIFLGALIAYAESGKPAWGSS